MLRSMFIAILLTLLPIGAAAQTDAQAAPAAQPAPATTQQLIDLLRDDAAREALIDQLEAAASPEAEPVVESGESAAASLDGQIAAATQSAAQALAQTAEDVLRRVRILPTTLDGLLDAIDPQVFFDALSDLAFVIAATYAAFLVLRLVSRRIARRLADQASQARWPRRVGLSLLSSALDAVVVGLAWAAGYALTVVFYDGFGVIQIRQSLYLNAFLFVELAKVAGRVVLAPRFDALRLVPLSRAAAGQIWGWLNSVIVLLGYGLLLAVPIVNNAEGYFSGSALGLAVSILAIVYTMIRVRGARQNVAHWLHARSTDGVKTSEDTPVLAQLTALWHWPVQLYLAALLFLVLVRPGNVLLPLLKTSGIVLGVAIGGLLLWELLLRTARRGVRLPGYLKFRLPTLEQRLNRLVPQAFLALRVLLAIAVVATLLAIVSGWDLRAWLASPTVTFLLGKGVAVALILLAAFAIWLAVASWIEYRLNPSLGLPPKPRVITLLTLLRNAVTIGLLILTTMFVLSEIGLDIGPLLASAGVLGLAIGFGAQKMVQDIITGIFIQFENAINVGDVITVSGVTGTVEKLTVRSVSLRDVEGVFHIIPFSSVDMVSNYMRDFSYYLADMGVAYREDMAEAKAAMHDAFDELRQDPEVARNILGDLEWFGLNSFDESAITLRARIKTIPGQQWGTGRAYNLILKRIFDERGIEIPFPHQTIYFGADRVGNAPPLHIRAEAPVAVDPAPQTAAPMASPKVYDTPSHGDVDPGQGSRGEGDGR